MYEFIGTEDYAFVWMMAPFWFISAFILKRMGRTPGRISRLRYWGVAHMVGGLSAAALVFFWTISAQSETLGWVYLLLLLFGFGAFQAWWALGRAEDMNTKTAGLPAFAWFPIVGLFLVFGRPQDTKFSSPTWVHFAGRFFGAIALAVFGYGAAIATWAYSANNILYAQLEIDGYPNHVALGEMVKETRASLPVRIDSETVWVGYDEQFGNLVYTYALGESTSSVDPIRFLKWGAENLVPQSCEEEANNELLQRGVETHLVYLRADGAELASFELTDETCAAAGRSDYAKVIEVQVLDQLMQDQVFGGLMSNVQEYFPDEAEMLVPKISEVVMKNDDPSELKVAMRDQMQLVVQKVGENAYWASQESLREFVSSYHDVLLSLQGDMDSCNAFFMVGGSGLNLSKQPIEVRQEIVDFSDVLYSAYASGMYAPVSRDPIKEADWEEFISLMYQDGVTSEEMEAMANSDVSSPYLCKAGIRMMKVASQNDSAAIDRIRAATLAGMAAAN